jgi:PEP-CTERM motif
VTFRRIFFTLLAAASFAAPSYATILAKYDFGTTTVPSLASSDSDLNSVAGVFSAGTGYTSVTIPDTGHGNPAPDITVGAGTTPGDAPSAISGNDYFTFTLTPVSAVNLTTLTFDTAVTGTVTGSYFLQAAVGAGSFSNVGSTVNYSNSSFATQSISLSASQFQNLTLPVTFRIYIYDNKSGSMNDLLDNVTLNGVAVPEPSTWAMMGLGAGLLGAVQRFRQKRR